MPIALSGTNGITFPTWTTATRPASPATGQTGFNTTTGQLESYDGTQWEIYTAASSQGTSGQPLISSGSGVAPTFTTLGISAITATGTPSASTFLRGDSTWSAVSASGQLIRAPQIKTSGTSYTTPSNCTAIYVEAVGGGGGSNYTGANTTTNSSGGGGAYCAKYFTVTGNTAYTYAIGAAGAAGSGTGNGGTGGSTTFTVGATTITAAGGVGGGAGSTGGTATNGDINSGGGAGFGGLAAGGTGLSGLAAAGGSSVLGGGGRASAGNGYGGGAGSAVSGTSTTYAGAQGVIRIWEYT